MEKDQQEIFREILINNSKVVGNCIEWTGKTNQGYGYIYAFKKTWAIHRISFVLEKGEIPEGFYVLHICNNKKCFNPRHLYAGTPKDNSEDLRNSDYYEDVLEKISKYRKKEYEKYSDFGIQPEFLSIEEVSKIFNVHSHTIRRAIKKGYIVGIRIGEGKKSPYRVSKKAIEAIHSSLLRELSAKSRKN